MESFPVHAYVVGRFPPPVDGQTLATERLATLLEDAIEIRRFNTELTEETSSTSTYRFLLRAAHFPRLRKTLSGVLAEHPRAVVFWPAVSPDPLGHLRDLLVTIPAFRSTQRGIAIVHRGNFHILFESSLTKHTSRRIVDSMQVFVFLTHGLAERCARWIPDYKRVVIPNTIDSAVVFTDEEVERKLQIRRRRERVVLLFLSHMLAAKGYLEALDAVHHLCCEGVDVEAHFVGGWMREADQREFLERVRSHKIEDVVDHHGRLSNRNAVKKLYGRADVFLFPTYYRNEAQPLVILEAMNAGIPVVSTHHAGIPEMIRHEREGLLVPPRNTVALANAVRRLVDLPYWTKLAKQARKRFNDEYAPGKVREQWLQLIQG